MEGLHFVSVETTIISNTHKMDNEHYALMLRSSLIGYKTVKVSRAFELFIITNYMELSTS
jgi:hypothetical protein